MLNRDLTHPRWMYLKAGLFLLGALMASAAILAEHPTWKHAMLLALAVWCACRAYYFAFYVIEHYIDGEYRFAGLGSFAIYVLSRKKKGPRATASGVSGYTESDRANPGAPGSK